MIRSTRGLATALLAAAALAGHAQPASAPPAGAAGPVPLEAFFKPAQLEHAQLSPSGRYLAALRGGVAERVGFLIIDLDGKEGSRFVSASPRDDVTWFQWVSDDLLVFSVRDPAYRGKGALGGGLMSMSRDGKSSRQLIARDWEKKADDVHRRHVLTPAHYFIRRGPLGSQEVIVGQRHYNANYEYDFTTLHALNVVSGQLRALDAPRADWWLLDGRAEPRVAVRTLKGQTTVSAFDRARREWQPLYTAPQFEPPWVPVAARDEDRLLVRTLDAQGYYELREFDMRTRNVSDKVILSTPGFSSGFSLRYDSESSRLLGMHVLVDSWVSTWFDAHYKALQAKADAKLPDRVNQISCGASCIGAKRVLVDSSSDTDPGMSLLYMPETDQWQLVGRTRPDIAPERMAHMELYRPKARDGEDLPVWITRAPNLPADKPAAAVVLLHGGPWVRGTHWDWHAEAQFLASRGYLVIEPEFRGSTGYGTEHFRKGFKQWGLAMQDDVTDALKFAVDKGWVDPQRVCLMGASYGGYATLMGLAKDPDLYRCGIAFAAVSDQRNMFDFFWNDIADEAKAYDLKELLGDRVKDEARFIATSPLEQAGRIKAPLLLMHGGEDRRVPVQNAERMHDALKKAGKPVEWVLYPGAFHGFPVQDDEYDYYRRIEAFLARHLR